MAQNDGRVVYASEAKKFEFWVHLDHFSKFLKYFEKLYKWTKNLDFFASEANALRNSLPSFWAKLVYSRIKIGLIIGSFLKLQTKIGVHLINVELSKLLTPVLGIYNFALYQARERALKLLCLGCHSVCNGRRLKTRAEPFLMFVSFHQPVTKFQTTTSKSQISHPVILLQGVRGQSGFFNLALRERNIQVRS